MENSYAYPRPPSLEEIREYAADLGIHLTDEEAATFTDLATEVFQSYRVLENADGPAREHRPRTTGRRARSDENPHNALISMCEVPGDEDGPLSGHEVGIKDSISVAGVEMTCGSSLFEGYVPTQDATVVSRLLDAGATVTAKTNMEDMAWSGSGELSAFGPVANPVDPNHLAGGSSGGSAAAVASGQVDAALGTDQGGSVRMPAAWCGVVGLKPTYGLVPYTGVVALTPEVDHVGPLARSVSGCARLLSVLAGPDGLDTRQQRPVNDNGYTDLKMREELSVGVLTEGFDREESDPAVDGAVHDALSVLRENGATVEDVSVPKHGDADAIANSIYHEGAAAMFRAEGVGRFTKGHYDESFSRTFARARRTEAGRFPPMMKFALVVGEYAAEEFLGKYYIRAQNLRRELSRAYDEALERYDVLALPTIPFPAIERVDDLSLTDRMSRSLAMNGNTSPFNLTGHPAISVPCGRVEGLPVGLMLVGSHDADRAVLETAYTFEQLTDYGAN